MVTQWVELQLPAEIEIDNAVNGLPTLKLISSFFMLIAASSVPNHIIIGLFSKR
jgi:hypothetical protein